MKELKLYQCQVCGRQYSNKSKCIKCEQNHIKPLNFGECKYLPVNVGDSRYPVKIDVLFENGEKVRYRR